VTPEANGFLVKAHTLLGRAATMLGVALYEDAGRNAYLAGSEPRKLMLSTSPARWSNRTRAYRWKFCA
jgi:hypothetical protein